VINFTVKPIQDEKTAITDAGYCCVRPDPKTRLETGLIDSFYRLCQGLAEISPFSMFDETSHPLTRNYHSLTGTSLSRNKILT